MPVYLNPTVLGVTIKIMEDTLDVIVDEDKKCGTPGKVTYTKEEWLLLNKLKGGMTKEIHQVKNIFDGTIVRVEENKS